MDGCADNENDPKQAAIAEAITSAEVVRQKPLGPLSETEPDIVPLGHAAGIYYFISSDGEQRHFGARELVRLNIASLFGGETSWLCDNFPCYNKKGDRIDGAFNANNAAEWLMRQCSLSGLYNPDTPLRRLGVWRAKNAIVAHLGSSIWFKGEKHKPGCLIDGAIYPACNNIKPPTFDHPADRFDGLRLRTNLNAWSFTQDYDADLLFGWLGAALLGGYPSWRVHALVTGERGTGKSTIGEYLMNVIGAQGLALNDYTEAGLRQTLTNEGRTPHIDEGESAGEEQAHRMARVIGLLRKMSGGRGAVIVRGTSGGAATNSTVTGCVLLTAINPPPLQPQDKSRILSVGIGKPNGGCSADDVRAILGEAASLSSRIRARALLGADRFAAAFDVYRKFILAHGCDARQADLFSTLCAGRSLLLDDDVPSMADAEEFVTQLRGCLSLIMVDDSDASDGQSCLNRLLDAECPSIRDGIRRSVGQIVSDSMDTIANGSYVSPENDKLVPMGIRIVDVWKGDGAARHGIDPGRYLFVSNDGLGLKKIFHNTPWADGNWRASLLRVPGVRPSPAPVSVGRKARGLLVPRTWLPDYDNSRNRVDIPSPSPAPDGGVS